jgi:hypothetical protein
MRWMLGPYTEMISGGSGGYGFLSLCIHGPPAGISSYVPLGLLPIAVLVTRVRHYGATHLRVYLRKHDHEKYRKKLRPRASRDSGSRQERRERRQPTFYI